ncbi:MAG: phage tail protein [Cytophagia bacterium]|nr:MAG: phage tail protein [Cytophagia bacterium]TAG43803.1 MAG: phage tail protein [Cytophagia bacterium]TAH28940.1 MAG: phage tail protein [Cytophagales bacterium]
MADATELWPIPKFHFTVQWEGVNLGFQEVSGLKLTTDMIEYRTGNDPTFIKQRVPGLKKFENVTLKKAMFKNDTALYDWYADVQKNPERRKDITIQLLDEQGAPLIVWTIVKAFPLSISGPDLNSTGNELAVETLELAHEGITMAKG